MHHIATYFVNLLSTVEGKKKHQQMSSDLHMTVLCLHSHTCAYSNYIRHLQVYPINFEYAGHGEK